MFVSAITKVEMISYLHVHISYPTLAGSLITISLKSQPFGIPETVACKYGIGEIRWELHPIFCLPSILMIQSYAPVTQFLVVIEGCFTSSKIQLRSFSYSFATEESYTEGGHWQKVEVGTRQ